MILLLAPTVLHVRVAVGGLDSHAHVAPVAAWLSRMRTL